MVFINKKNDMFVATNNNGEVSPVMNLEEVKKFIDNPLGCLNKDWFAKYKEQVTVDLLKNYTSEKIAKKLVEQLLATEEEEKPVDATTKKKVAKPKKKVAATKE